MALTKVRGSGLDSSQEGAITFNEGSADVDFRVESNGNTHALFVDAGNDRVGIGTSSPDGGFHVKGMSDHGRFILESGGTSGANNNMFMQFHNNGGTEIAQIAIEEGATNEGQIMFKTGGTTERMRIKNNGVIMIPGTHSDTSSSERVSISVTSGSTNGINFIPTNSSGGVAIATRTTGGSGVGGVSFNSSSTSFNTSSDYRLKENVTTSWDATSRLKQLKPSRFNFKVDADKTVDGFLAHEVSSIVPEAINGEKDAVDKNGNIEPQSIDQSKLVPLLTKALQEAVAKIEILEAKVTALEGK